MHLLSCPDCQTQISVSPAQAGDSVKCSKCGGQVTIPKLGVLRQLPLADEQEAEVDAGQRSVGGTIAFVVLSLLAVAALMGAAYNGVRWASIDAGNTTETHLAGLEKDYLASEPAMMIIAFEDMEKYSLDLVLPYGYQKKVDEKSKWGWNAVIAAGLVFVSGTGALVAATKSRTE